MHWIAGASTHGCWLGTYELDKMRALTNFVRPGMTVYDIGAQAGYYSLAFSRMVAPGGQVIAFEPCPAEARVLLEHLRINRVTNVRVFTAAVSDRSGYAAFTIDRGKTMNFLAETDEGPLLTATVTLDGLALPPADVIKMDVEGAESAVLAGARETLQRHAPIVFVALHSDEQKRLCVGSLRTASYRTFDLAGRETGELPDTDEIYALPQS